MIVEEGPKWLNRDVVNEARIIFETIDGIKVKNIPKKQYLIWMRSSPIEFLKDLIRKNIPRDIEIIKYSEKKL